jgi:hypothetical protein
MKTYIVSLLFLVTGIALFAQNPVNLTLNLEKGKTYSIKAVSNQKIQQTANGQQFAMDVKSVRVVRYKVLGQVNNILDLELSLDTIATKISSPVYNMESNSAKPGSEPKDKIMNRISTTKLVVKITTSGKFIDIVNYAQFRDKIMPMLDSVPASKRDEAKKMADMLIKKTAMQSMIEPFFAYLPEKAVKTGDKWETSYISTANDQSSIMMNTFTLIGMDQSQASFSGTSELESMPSTDPNAQVSQELKGTATIEGSIDLITGLALNSTEKGHFEGITKVRNAGQVMEMPIKVDSQSETTMSK